MRNSIFYPSSKITFMRFKYLLFVLILIGPGISCKKQDSALHNATVLAATCPFQSVSPVAVQLDHKDPLSFAWTNPFNGVIYQNVIVTFNPALNAAIGKSLTYTTIRNPNSNDTLLTAVLAICISYPITYLNNITLK